MPGRSHMPPRESATGNWSDGETTTLIDTWGPLHLRRRPGGLFLEDWRAAARAVNAHRAAAGRRFNRTRVQCQTRVRTLKKRYKEELPKQPPSEWRHLPRLRAFLSSPDDSPPGFPATVVKQEVEEEEEEDVVVEEELAGGGIGLAASWTVPRRPRNAAAGTEFSPGAVVVKLAEVYERVELAKIAAEKVKTETEEEMEVQKAMFDAVKMEQ